MRGLLVGWTAPTLQQLGRPMLQVLTWSQTGRCTAVIAHKAPFVKTMFRSSCNGSGAGILLKTASTLPDPFIELGA
jgi:hypothetical protein